MNRFWRTVHSFRWPYGCGSASSNGRYWPRVAAALALKPYRDRLRFYARQGWNYQRAAPWE